MGASIHPAAFVSPKAELADGVIVGPCAVIEEDVVVGSGCRIDAFASVKRYTSLGPNCHIHSYALVGGEPQDLKYAGEPSRLELGADNVVREFATLHRGTAGGGGLTKIGDKNLFMAYSHVAHDCILGNGVVMSNGATLAGHIEVGDGVIIAGLSAVHQFTRLGAHCFVGGMTGISQDLPPYMLAVGPRADIRGPNVVGLRRMGLGSSTVTAVRSAFRLIWLSGIPRADALIQAEHEFAEVPEVLEIIRFVRESKRGVLNAERSSREDD
jgi:UDP-N-acetylglucosamine acyltransferase